MKIDQLSMETSQQIRTGIRKKFSGTIIFILAIFLPAGALNYPHGWLLLGLFITKLAYELLVLLPSNPALFAARSNIQKGTKKWDAILTTLTVIGLYLAALIIAGFDYRYQWSLPFQPWMVITGVVIWVLGSAFTFWAMHSP